MKLSIITPNYNYAEYLPSLLNSVLIQQTENVEYIIVDDGSTDNSIDILRSYSLKHPKVIKLIEQENHGQTYTINRALSEASGDIIGWINSDDIYFKNAFNEVRKAFVDDNIDVVMGDIILFDANSKFKFYRKYIPFNYHAGVYLGFGRQVSSNSIFWKKKLMTKNNITGLDNDFNYVMDGEFWSRLLYKAKIKKINYPLACWRIHEMAKTSFRQTKNDPAQQEANNENRIISERAFKKLPISKNIDFKYLKSLRYYHKLRRYILKLLHGCYFQKSRFSKLYAAYIKEIN